MRKHYLFALALCTSCALFAQEPEATAQAAPSSSEQSTASPSPAGTQAKPKPKQKPNAMQVFTKVVRILITLLRDPQVKENLKLIEKLIVAIIQTAQQVSQHANATTSTRSRLMDEDDLIAQLAESITSDSELQNMHRACTHQKHPGMDPATKEILLHFSAIVQYFFNILQNPENRNNVSANVIGMVTGIVSIGNIATADTSVSDASDTKELQKYAQSIDETTKRSMHQILISAQKRSGFIYE